MPVTTTKSGRVLAQERRGSLAKAGRSHAPVAATAGRQRFPASQAATSEASTKSPTSSLTDLCQHLDAGGDFGSETHSVRELCRLRRQAVSQNGKTAVKKPARPIQGADFHDAPPTAAVGNTLDDFCQQAETQEAAFGGDIQNVRNFCRQRRQALAHNGKTALAASKNVQAVNPSSKAQQVNRMGMMQGVYCAPDDQSCREAAKQLRQSRALNGRGATSAEKRPSGRVRPKSLELPEKVEVGTTLSGQFVTGTQVERTEKVTGNERGSCRSTVTGTEYLGQEQFKQFCESKPLANPPKVRQSQTSLGQIVSGAEVIPAKVSVTGGESGICRAITGTEYLGSERFEQFCEGRGFLPRVEKVVESQSPRKALKITGSDEARHRPISGVAVGADRQITGTQYADMHRARLTINGVEKVQTTHTFSGRSVSGSVVDRSSKVTGNETGSCRGITGTEYLSYEHYQNFCETVPKSTPHRVSVMPTRHGQSISGVSVERSEKVTGNEPGACNHITGSQYSETSLCDRRSAKSHSMKTLAGREVSGTAVASRPKFTGDARGGCLPVTGNEYYGQEYYAHCPNTPMPRPKKVGVSHTNRGQIVTGAMLERSNLVTGNEVGSTRPISGTPYGAARGIPMPAATFVRMTTLERPLERLPAIDLTDTCATYKPGCQLIDNTKVFYEQVDNGQIDNEQVDTHQQLDDMAMSAANVAPPVTPAQAAMPKSAVWSATAPFANGNMHKNPLSSAHQNAEGSNSRRWQPRRITGSAFAASEKITGPVNLANSLVSGTPEFRYREDRPLPTPLPVSLTAQNPPLNSAKNVTNAKNLAIPAEAMPPAAEQVTGEGRAAGRAAVSGESRITGDNWSRNSRVTGTEGRWSQGRNPTYRSSTGVREIPAVGAFANKDREKQQPVSNPKITGSSAGVNSKGPVVTLSGGARG